MPYYFPLRSEKDKNKNEELPPFGKVEKADLEMKECDFDKKAEAVILIDDARLDEVMGSGVEMKKRVRIKILSTKGLEYADIHLPYISAKNEEDINASRLRPIISTTAAML